MDDAKSRFYISTPIYYVNASPHIGHAYTSVLADSLARYNYLSGKEIFFLTGTDEHGAKVSRAADAKNIPVKDFVDENSERFRALATALNLSLNDFIRTSDEKKHWPGVEKLWQTLANNGDIYKSTYKGLYCVGCEAFITEKDLVDGKCVYHGKEPEIIEEENYFFRLSKYGDKIKDAIEKGEMKIFPDSRKNEVLSFINDGLSDISVSRPARDVKWGIPVPADPSQIIYVWLDALANYISALGFGRGDDSLFQKFWPVNLHVLAKDILRFHAVIWPAVLLSAEMPLPKALLVHGFINVSGKKMSKSIGNVVDPFDLISRYSADSLRHYLLREISPFEDGDFTEEKFKISYNANLANGLGNCVSRIVKMALSYFEGKVIKPDEASLSAVPLKEKGEETFSLPYIFEHQVWPEYEKLMSDMKINEAVEHAGSAVSLLDNYIQQYEPFKLIKTDPQKTSVVLWSLLDGIANISWLIYPFMPETAEKIMKSLGVLASKKSWQDFSVTPVENLFPKKL
ncbi:MAG: methionine--tRNA ligase [Candidatus Pacebacteria bacterium]|nr:methionine--tRNA ligase [Candidatus Paceibacterota bacterium]